MLAASLFPLKAFSSVLPLASYSQHSLTRRRRRVKTQLWASLIKTIKMRNKRKIMGFFEWLLNGCGRHWGIWKFNHKRYTDMNTWCFPRVNISWKSVIRMLMPSEKPNGNGWQETAFLPRNCIFTMLSRWRRKAWWASPMEEESLFFLLTKENARRRK